MKVNEFLKIWFDREIEDWGVAISQEYKDFQRNYRSVLKEIGEKIGFELCSFSKNHYAFSVVMKSNTTNQFYYISISDVRYLKNEWATNILYREIADAHNWTGSRNRYSTLEKLSENLISLDKQILQNLEKQNTRQESNQENDFDYQYA